MAQMNSRIERNKLGKTHPTVNDERYTPKSVVDYFGKFDYDPATTKEKAQEFDISCYDTIETDGLLADWTRHKRIWINPPFTRKLEFLEKAVETYATTNADIYFLCPIEYLTTAQFSGTVRGCHIYIPTGRISFINGKPGGKNGNSPAFGSVIVKIADKNSFEFVDIHKIKPPTTKPSNEVDKGE
jgi:phage N-6-adenine-methyltransferase